VTIFVVTRHVGGTNAWGGWRTPGIPTLPLLGWEHLERLTRRGVITAAHTRTHPVLTRVAAAALQDELLGCRDDLARRLGVRSGHLAYPYGDADGRVVAAAAQHYRWGYTTELRVLPDAAEPPLRLPRLDMYYFQKPGLLEAWGTSRFTRHVAWCRARRLVRAAVAGRPKPSTR
jgi:peptidoglycan/xylan/chitin deacetylase (PgdA/CDA1 family)